MTRTIIINFPTNIGDTILSLPALDRLRGTYPNSKITAIVSVHTRNLLTRNSNIDEVVLFDKTWRIRQKMMFSASLRGKYDLMVDFKNSLLPVIIGARRRTPFIRMFKKDEHAFLRYLSIVKKVASTKEKKSLFTLNRQEIEKCESYKLSPSVFIACSSRSSLKRYPYDNLAYVVEDLKKDYPLVVFGQDSDASYYGDILNMKGVTSLVGKTSISDLFYLLNNYARLVLCVDSSILHISSYLNKPTVAIFGSTSHKVYGPRSDNSVVLRRDDVKCAPCGKAQCNFNIECMKIDPLAVVSSVRGILEKM